MIRRLSGVLLPMLLASALPAQQPAEPGSQLTIYLLTMGPGDQVWEKFGHNAVWIHDEANHTDIAYHWGLFDFNDKDFVPRFIQGRMRYSMGAFDLNETLAGYRLTNRTVWAQRLNLTAAQKERLQQFVWWNVRPENRYYRYDYFRDNCSTRTRDAIDRALGGIIKSATDTIPSHTTFRSNTARLTQDDWAVFTGTMMGLGEPTDREISAYEEMFLPVRMMKRLKSIQVPTANGLAPLVAQDTILFLASRPPEAEKVTKGVAGYLLIAAVIIAIGVIFYRYGVNTGRLAGFLGLAGIWSFVSGLAGILLASLWSFTDHVYSYRNENLLQLDPLSIVAGILIFALIWKRRARSQAAPSATLTSIVAVVALLSVLGFLLKALPSFNQVNGWVIALALPLNVALAVAMISLRRRPAPILDEK